MTLGRWKDVARCRWCNSDIAAGGGGFESLAERERDKSRGVVLVWPEHALASRGAS